MYVLNSIFCEWQVQPHYKYTEWSRKKLHKILQLRFPPKCSKIIVKMQNEQILNIVIKYSLVGSQ